MYVRIRPDDGKCIDSEIDVDYSLPTPEMRRRAQEAVLEATGIHPEEQNSIFLPDSSGLNDIKKLTLPSDVELPAPAPSDEEYSKIFEHSLVYVANADEWTWDVDRDENRAKTASEDIEDAGEFLRDLYSELERSRTVDASLLDKYTYLRDGIKEREQEEQEELHNFLEVVSASSSSLEVTPTELECYDDIFRENTESFRKLKSTNIDSGMHALHFSCMLLQPPFFFDKRASLLKMEFAARRTFGLHMFVKPDDEAKIHKVTAQSTVAVIDELSGLPTLMCEVCSKTEKGSLEKMLLGGVVACRQWRYILPESLEEKNMLLGLSVRDNLVVDLFLFHAESDYNVEIFEKSFHLYDRDSTLFLARILFNYRDKLLGIVGQAEHGKIEMLRKVVSSATIPPSLLSLAQNYNYFQSSETENSDSE